MFIKFRRQNAFFNGLALLLMAVGMVVGVVAKESLVMVTLTACSTLLKGWIDFKKIGNKMEMSRFAFTTLSKICIELQNHAKGLPLDDLETFLIRCQVHEETICDLCPPLSDSVVQKTFKYTTQAGELNTSPCLLEVQEDALLNDETLMDQNEVANVESINP